MIPVFDVDKQEQKSHDHSNQGNRAHGAQKEKINILELANDDGGVQRRVPV